MRKLLPSAGLFLGVFVAIFVAVFTLAPGSSAAGGPAIWTVEKAEGRVWFFGSVHVLPDGEAWRTPEVMAAFDAADVVVLEMPLEEAKSVELQGYVIKNAFSPPLQPPLRARLSPEDRAAFDRAAQAAGLQPYQLDPMRPWFAAITMTMSLLTKSGFDPENGVDQHVEREARARNKEMAYFESAREQIDFFITLPEAVEMQMLLDTVREINETPDMVQQLLDAWRNADMNAMSELASDSYTSPELQRVLLTDRNKRWVAKIAPWLRDEKNYLIVVGAGHLAGPDSVIALLRQDGVEIAGP